MHNERFCEVDSCGVFWMIVQDCFQGCVIQFGDSEKWLPVSSNWEERLVIHFCVDWEGSFVLTTTAWCWTASRHCIMCTQLYLPGIVEFGTGHRQIPGAEERQGVRIKPFEMLKDWTTLCSATCNCIGFTRDARNRPSAEKFLMEREFLWRFHKAFPASSCLNGCMFSFCSTWSI